MVSALLGFALLALAYLPGVSTVERPAAGSTAAGPTPAGGAPAGGAPSPVPAARLAMPAEPVTVHATDDPAELAVTASAALFASAPVAVLAAADDAAGQATGAAVAQRAGVPLLLTPPGPAPAADPAGVRAELGRLGVHTVLAVGPAAARWASAGGPPAVVTEEHALPATAPAAARSPVLVLTADGPAPLAAVTTARAAGADPVELPGGDPRARPEALPAAAGRPVLALGRGFGDSRRLAGRLAVAATDARLPGGGQLLLPGRRIVALYGHPGAPALGALGEQGLPAAIARAQQLAAGYPHPPGEPVVPAFEIIATVADAAPGPDGDYSAEASVADLRPWVDAAGAAGVYVVLDLQPGRTDFLTQARRYTELLARPHVGLALDPEWRLGPQQRHREQIGSVPVEEVNAVIGWLADLTRERALPQKLLMVHQFRTFMIAGRERLDTARDELAVVLHADGFGVPADKLGTWDALHRDVPPGVFWGWKNFIDEDRPMFSPAETVRIGPAPPVFVSYQ